MTKAKPGQANQQRGGRRQVAGSRQRRVKKPALVGNNDPAANQAAMAAAGTQYFSIGELSAIFGITTRAIRFYEAKGLIAPVRRGTTRLYTRRDRARLQMILRGKNLGFSLEEIREFLDLYDADPSMTLQTRHLLKKIESAITDLACKRADIDRSLQELAQIRSQCIEHLKKDC